MAGREHNIHPMDIQMDMEEAKRLLFHPSANTRDNPFRLNKACFFCEQVIEKVMKYDLEVMLHPKEYRQIENKHNISVMCVKMAEHNKRFSRNHPYIVKNAPDLGKLNGARYGHVRITQADAQKIYSEAKKMYDEFLKLHPNVLSPKKSAKSYKKLSPLFEKD